MFIIGKVLILPECVSLYINLTGIVSYIVEDTIEGIFLGKAPALQGLFPLVLEVSRCIEAAALVVLV